MGYYKSYKAVFDAVRTVLSGISSIKQVNVGEQLKVGSLPLAVVNPEETEITQVDIGGLIQNKINFTVIIVVRETEPEDWFEDVVSVMGDVVDAFLADRTLNGTVKDLSPTFFTPGEIRFTSRLYYGGAVRFTALLLYKQ
ncbi:hypothetical protein J7L06_00540 [Candidatus Bathyarchaeota archaeon]|nr:hypothetical protein [Candidatus Bathyarchaeota archaeon]